MEKIEVFLLKDWKNSLSVCILCTLSLYVLIAPVILCNSEWRFRDDFDYLNSFRFENVGKAALKLDGGPDGGIGVRKPDVELKSQTGSGANDSTGDSMESVDELTGLKREVAELKQRLERSEAERFAAQAELGIVRNGLGELLDKLQKKDGELQELQLKFGGMLESNYQDVSVKREVQLLDKLSEISKRGESLIGSVAEFCKQADSLLDEIAIDEVRKAQLLISRNNLTGELRKFSMATGAIAVDASVDQTRVYAVDGDLGLVVLPVGINHGAFQGLILYGVGKDPVQVRIVSVRPFVSGAVVSVGSISDVHPGMELFADVNKIKE